MSKQQYDRPTPADMTLPEEVYQTLRDPSGKMANVENRRAHERTPWAVSLVVTVDEKNEGRIVQRKLEVMTHDLSRGGFSFLYQQYLNPGTRIAASIESQPDRPAIIGVIANCVYIGTKQHRVGVRFVLPDNTRQSD